MPDPFSLQGKTVLVTGGTRGVGRAISLGFARAGAAVLANYVRNEEAANELLVLAREEGLRLRACRADLTNDADMKTLVASLSDFAPRLSAFVHCAATGIHRPLQQLTLRHFDWTFSLNVRAFFSLMKTLLPQFDRGSSIVAISSEGAVRAVSHYALVGSSKGALESLARHFAADLAPAGIRVNVLASGSVLTDTWKALPDSERRLAATVRKTPLQRLVTLEEVALAAQFLCSDASSGMIGQTLVVDGGARITACD
jgi:NAD(P)-dependent dehydrogenase (short-subunit alcohol dehydrogenase family)